MLSSQKYQSLLNGGGTAAGVRGLFSEIKALEAENETSRQELCGMPAMRIDLILADDPQAAIDKLEARERELERIVERNAMMLVGLTERLAVLRRTELAPRIKFHQDALAKIGADVERAVVALMTANAAAADALTAAQFELGDDGTPLLAPVGFGGLPNEMCLQLWRGTVAAQRERIAREQTSEEQPVSRNPAFNLNDIRPPLVRTPMPATQVRVTR